MKALVTGANGFVGQHLVRELQQSGYEVTATGQAGASPFAQEIEFKAIDLTNADETAAINFSDVDVIFHLAGLAAVGLSYDHPREYVETNTAIQINLSEACIRQAARPRMMLVSSGGLYDPRAALPLTENSPTLPSSPYAVSKLAQEALAKYYGIRGMDVVIVRPFNHIGPGQAAGFLLPDLVAKIRTAKERGDDAINIGDLTTKRDYTDVRDIVKAYVMLTEKGKPGEIYNICSGKAVSGTEILEHLMRLLDYQVEVKINKALLRPTDAAEIYGSYEKLSCDTGWKPEIDLETTLKDILS